LGRPHQLWNWELVWIWEKTNSLLVGLGESRKIVF
jgi:hypothetical protein